MENEQCAIRNSDGQLGEQSEKYCVGVSMSLQGSHETDISKFCTKCGIALSKDEIALHKKLYNRAAKSFLCIKCSSEYLEVTQEMLAAKIEEFKKMGCTLFS